MINSSTAWAFGLSVTVLLIAVWGRAVVVDTETLGMSLRPLSYSDLVSGVLEDWLEDELAESGYDPAAVDPAVDVIVGSVTASDVLEGFVEEVVTAAASPDPAGSSVDVATLLWPTVPDVTLGLRSLGMPVDQTQVADTIAQFDPLVIRGPGSAPVVGAASPAASRLGTAAALAVLSMVVFGYFTVVSSEDRVLAARGLFTRVAVGGLGFSVILLIGSWITDPRGGRAPIGETASMVAASKWMVPFQVGVAAAIVAVTIYLVRRGLRRNRELSAGPESAQPTELSRTASR